MQPDEIDLKCVANPVFFGKLITPELVCFIIFYIADQSRCYSMPRLVSYDKTFIITSPDDGCMSPVRQS
jgi:hypothetical protein